MRVFLVFVAIIPDSLENGTTAHCDQAAGLVAGPLAAFPAGRTAPEIAPELGGEPL